MECSGGNLPSKLCGVSADDIFSLWIVMSRELMILSEDLGVDVCIKSLFQMQIKFKADRCFLELKKKGFFFCEQN